jgi:predicted HD phosphohydrolase
MEPTNTAQEILHLFRQHGHIEYGERCTQLSHAVQAGLIAKEKGYGDELILAAFLHDIGHLYPLEFGQTAFQTMGNFGMEAHDRWGGECLRKWGFSDRIAATVKNHVAAKRYLCLADARYYDQLSEASKETLRYQGGPMTEEEARAFEKDPFFDDSIRIRLVDDEAKAEDFEVTEGHWAYFRELLERLSYFRKF